LSLGLLESVVRGMAHISNAEDIAAHVPVFSQDHAETIWDITCDTLEYEESSSEDESHELNRDFIFPPHCELYIYCVPRG